jgi:integrase
MALSIDKKTGKWKVNVWFRSRKIVTKSFSKKALAEKFERDTLLALEKQQISGTHSKDYTYNEIFEFWYINATARKRHRSLIKDSQMYKNYIQPPLGELRVSEINVMHFEKIVSIVMKKELTKATANLVIQHFKAVFNYSYMNDLIARHPAKNFKQLRLDKKEMSYFSQDEMDQLLSYTHQKYIGEERWKHAMYLTLFLTGGRLGEVLGLEWNRINFERDTIIFSQMWDGVDNKIVKTTKGRKDRVVPMNSLLKKELGSIRNRSKGSYIFSDVEDRPIDPSNFRNRNWEKDLVNAGIRPMRIHDCRHTYASLFVMNGGKLYDLKTVLGHADMKTTERYAHLSNEHLAGVRDIIKPRIEYYAEVIYANSDVLKNSSPSIHPLNLDYALNVV